MRENPYVYQGLRHAGCSYVFKSMLAAWQKGDPGIRKSTTVFSFWVKNGSQWWLTSVISALGRLGQENCLEFKASLHYRVKSCFENPKQKKTNNPSDDDEWLTPTKSPQLVPREDTGVSCSNHTSLFMYVLGNTEHLPPKNKTTTKTKTEIKRKDELL